MMAHPKAAGLIRPLGSLGLYGLLALLVLLAGCGARPPPDRPGQAHPEPSAKIGALPAPGVGGAVNNAGSNLHGSQPRRQPVRPEAAESRQWQQPVTPGVGATPRQELSGRRIGRLPSNEYFELVRDLHGEASWYGPQFHGKRTANGEIYNQYGMTAAHPVLPMGTRIQVENLENGKKVVVRINDRGPYKKGRILDLTRTAAQRLAMLRKGTAMVKISVLSWPIGMDPSKGLKAYRQFVVQVAAYPRSEKAESHRGILQTRYSQLDFMVDRTPSGRFAVVTGPYDNEKEARRVARKLSKEGVTNLVRNLRK